MNDFHEILINRVCIVLRVHEVELNLLVAFVAVFLVDLFLQVPLWLEKYFPVSSRMDFI